MAETTTSPNNKSVKFRGRPKQEPTRANEFAALSPQFPKPTPAKKAAKKVPARVRTEARGLRRKGMISEKAMAKHFGGE